VGLLPHHDPDAASVPLFWAADKVSRKWFNELFYRYYEGFSEDRLVILSEELFEEVILPNIYRARATSSPSRDAPASARC
jgi:hypothetical protein